MPTQCLLFSTSKGFSIVLTNVKILGPIQLVHKPLMPALDVANCIVCSIASFPDEGIPVIRLVFLVWAGALAPSIVETFFRFVI